MVRLIYPYQKNKRFYNYKYHQPESLLFGTIPSTVHSLLFRPKIPSSELAQWHTTVPVVQRSITPLITWIGHATFLIQIGGLNIVTDPVFTTPLRMFPRLLPLGITLEQLPPIDLVLISHNHFDHMDSASLHGLKRHAGISFLVPQGDKAWLVQRKFGAVHEYMWWEKYTVEREGQVHDLVCTFLPAFHWSGRGLLDKNRSLWGSWMISYADYHIYFGGDTAHGPHFHQIGTQFPAINTALLPISPGQPFAWMKHNHMNAAQAVQSFIALGAQQLIPMHWGTFAQGSEPFLAPINGLTAAWQEYSDLLLNKKLQLLKVGERAALD